MSGHPRPPSLRGPGPSHPGDARPCAACGTHTWVPGHAAHIGPPVGAASSVRERDPTVARPWTTPGRTACAPAAARTRTRCGGHTLSPAVPHPGRAIAFVPVPCMRPHALFQLGMNFETRALCNHASAPIGRSQVGHSEGSTATAVSAATAAPNSAHASCFPPRGRRAGTTGGVNAFFASLRRGRTLGPCGRSRWRGPASKRVSPARRHCRCCTPRTLIGWSAAATREPRQRQRVATCAHVCQATVAVRHLCVLRPCAERV